MKTLTKKQLCLMCDEYSFTHDCDHKENCKLLAILDENSKLKEENKKLKNIIDELRLEMSYMINPNTLGYKHEMGSW